MALVARTAEAHDHLAGSLQDTAERLRKFGQSIGVVVADLTVDTDRARVIAEAADVLGGPIDVLVNNAAAAIYGHLADMSLKRRRILFEANVHAPVDLSQAAIPAMKAAGAGWIVNVSSGTARPADTSLFGTGADVLTMAAYGASKAALNRATNGLGAELFGTGIRVNGVEPRAAVLTEGADALVGDRLRPDQIEPIESMVEAIVALCDCPAEVTGQSFVSLDLLEAWGIDVRALDGGGLP